MSEAKAKQIKYSHCDHKSTHYSESTSRPRHYHPEEESLRRKLLQPKSSEKYLVDRRGRTFASATQNRSNQQLSDSRYNHMLTPDGKLKLLNTNISREF
jgi:hypothetical protein